MPTYRAGLCRMVNGVVQAPYDGKSFEAEDDPEAIQRRKNGRGRMLWMLF